MRSVRQSHFSRIPQVKVRRSVFNRSHTLKTTFNAGYLVPVFLDEVLPGDTFSLRFNFFCRLSTPIVPFMDNLYLEYFYFFVPNRILWEHWENFMGQQDQLNASTDYVVPTVTFSNVPSGSIADYFGLPVGNKTYTVNALPFRAYYRIYNEWFRDENLVEASQEGLTVGDGPDESDIGFGIKRRGKRHDYFTSCLPWPQKGPGVEIPLTGDAAVYYSGIGYDGQPVPEYGTVQHDFVGIRGTDNKQLYPLSALNQDFVDFAKDVHPVNGRVNALYADLSSVSSATINSLRQAFQLQKFYELNARGGTRYTEILRAHFGVVSPDQRLQRPEYLGGGSRRIVIKPVEQNSASDTTSPQGNLAAYGLVGDSSHVFTKSFVEHGYIIGLVNVRADLTYQQGINRMWSRSTREDFYFPVFAHLGEQAVLNKEIFLSGSSVDDDVFGYQERWAEYRYKPSMITGKFRSGLDDSLDVWHLSQYFEDLPTLSENFIVDRPPVERVVAVQDEPQFLFDSQFDLKCVRPMPVYSVPGLVDHF